MLEAGIPLLHVGRGRVRIDSEVSWQAGGGGLRESIARGQDGSLAAVGDVVLDQNAIEHQIVNLDRDLGAVIDAVSRAKNRLAFGERELWKPPGQSHARREVSRVRTHRLADPLQLGRRRTRSGAIHQVQQIPPRFRVRGDILVAQAEVQREPRTDPPIVLHEAAEAVLPQVRLRVPFVAAGVLRESQ